MSWLDTKPPVEVDDAVEKLFEDGTLRARYVDEYASGDVRFGLWLYLVDARLARGLGVSHRDLSDWTWRDAFDEGMSPKEAGLAALAADDTFSSFFGGE
jgi:hypothetical protein